LKPNKILAVDDVHARAKFHRAKCMQRFTSYRGNRQTNKKYFENDADNNRVFTSIQWFNI